MKITISIQDNKVDLQKIVKLLNLDELEFYKKIKSQEDAVF